MYSSKRPIVYQRRDIISPGRERVGIARAAHKLPRNWPELRPATSIVVPVMNESANVPELVRRVRDAVAGHPTEIVFVDDSRDTLTVEAAKKARVTYRSATFDVLFMHRTGSHRRGGLSGAVLDGMAVARSNQVLVMDGDLQHPPETIPAILAAATGHDVVVASRYCIGGSSGGLDGGLRHIVSRYSTVLAKIFFPFRLYGVTDPMTGFFLVDTSKIERWRVRAKGFKILLGILATHSHLSKTEVPLQFAPRMAGESHGDLKQGLAFVTQLLDLRFGFFRQFARLPKFVQFGGIGGGVFVVGMGLLYGLVEYAHVPTLVANAIQLAVTFWLNYVLNKHITWRSRRISRRAAYKFLSSRAATTVLNYLLFAWLISLEFKGTVLGHGFDFTVHYLVANVIALATITVLNYEISDRWAFAEPKVAQPQPKASAPAVAASPRHHVGLTVSLVTFAVLIGVVALALVTSPEDVIPVVLAATSLSLLLQASIEVWRMVYSYREPESIDRLQFPAPLTDGPHEKFCIIVPARHEAAIIGHTLTTLAAQKHKNTDIITVICDDDKETLAAARKVARRTRRMRVVVFPLQPGMKPSKPLQLNYVLQRTENKNYTVVGIFDAEDTVHPDLLLHVEAAFADPDIDIVQGGVQLMNHDSSWYALHNVLEYYRWFNSAMAYNAEKQFMPLGGNTVFVRNRLLREAGGWPVTLTEDCSLGVLLSTRFHARTAVYYEPHLSTQEETPGSLADLFRQRVRWNQGYYHEWRAGVWLELSTFRRRLLAGYMLLGPLLLAIISIFAVVSLLAILYLSAPVILVMLMYLPLVPGILLVILNGIFLHDFGKAYGRKIKLRQYFILFITQIPYLILLNTAALWSVIREMRGDNSWHKTTHSGLHRQDQAGGRAEPLQPAYATVAVPVPTADEPGQPPSEETGDDNA